MARKKGTKLEIRQESIKTPNKFDYDVRVVPSKDSRGNNRLEILTPGGKPLKELHVRASEGSGKRLVVGWRLDTSRVPREKPAHIQIHFPIGTPFSYILGPIEIDHSFGAAHELIWKRIKRKGNVMHQVKFHYTVVVTTKDVDGVTETYVAEMDDPMVIVD
jgi:hypothetical protein